VTATEIFEHYRRWADGHQLSDRERLSRTKFGYKLSERFEKLRERTVRKYRGLARRV
jgi:hypothetical protein